MEHTCIHCTCQLINRIISSLYLFLPWQTSQKSSSHCSQKIDAYPSWNVVRWCNREKIGNLYFLVVAFNAKNSLVTIWGYQVVHFCSVCLCVANGMYKERRKRILNKFTCDSCSVYWLQSVYVCVRDAPVWWDVIIHIANALDKSIIPMVLSLKLNTSYPNIKCLSLPLKGNQPTELKTACPWASLHRDFKINIFAPLHHLLFKQKLEYKTLPLFTVTVASY